MAESLTERRPTLPGWYQHPSDLVPLDLRLAARCLSLWQNGTTWVISTLVDAELPDGSGVLGPQWHLSITRHAGGRVRRPAPQDIRRARRAFGLQAAEEDNHHPGNARHLFMVVDPAKRVDCECKTDEQLVVEPDGFKWTNPKDGPCRGCELAGLTGKPCPLHAPDPRGVLQP